MLVHVLTHLHKRQVTRQRQQAIISTETIFNPELSSTTLLCDKEL